MRQANEGRVPGTVHREGAVPLAHGVASVLPLPRQCVVGARAEPMPPAPLVSAVLPVSQRVL